MTASRPDARCLVVATGHALSLALLAGHRVLATHHDERARGHAEALLPVVQAMLAAHSGPDSGPDSAPDSGRPPVGRIVVETGPGSFTGLRIGYAAATALGLAWQVPVGGVRSTVLAQAGARAAGVAGPLFVALAAPRGQIWCEAFAADDRSLGPPQALTAEAVAGHIPAGATIVGSAAPALAGSAPPPSLCGAPQAAWFSHLADQPLAPAALLYVRPDPRAAAPAARATA